MGDDSPASACSRRDVLKATGLAIPVGSNLRRRRSRHGRTFVAHLNSANVPESDEYSPYTRTNAHGVTVCHLYPPSRKLRYTALVANMDGVTGVHVHRGGPAENGPHLAEFVNYADPTGSPVVLKGTLAPGDECPNESGDDNCLTRGVPFETLVDELRSGTAYVQAHAEDGVIRGQLG